MTRYEVHRALANVGCMVGDPFDVTSHHDQRIA